MAKLIVYFNATLREAAMKVMIELLAFGIKVSEDNDFITRHFLDNFKEGPLQGEDFVEPKFLQSCFVVSTFYDNWKITIFDVLHEAVKLFKKRMGPAFEGEKIGTERVGLIEHLLLIVSFSI